ncbi:MAG TPA: Rv3235 family protein, partial [Frankiaceae bacterium]
VAVVRTPRTALPDPRRVAPTAVRGLLEVVAGERPARHLRGLLTPRVALQLDRIRRPGRCSTGTVRSIRVSEPTPGVAEVCAVVRRGERYAFLAARLQGLDGRWQVTHLQLGF